MTIQELKEAFNSRFTQLDENGNPAINGKPRDIIDWISQKFQPAVHPFSKAFTGMHDKNGTPINEGDLIKLYHKGDYFTCQVIYDSKHAAFFIKWQDGYVNHFFMNGAGYEVINEK